MEGRRDPPEGDSGFDRRHESSAAVAQQIYDYFDRAIDDHIASPATTCCRR